MSLLRKYLIGSLTIHLMILVIASIIGMHRSTLKKTFIVFGAHSRKHTSVVYKTSKIVPFVGNGKRHNKGHSKGRGGGHGNGRGKGRGNKGNHGHGKNGHGKKKVARKKASGKNKKHGAKKAVNKINKKKSHHSKGKVVKATHKGTSHKKTASKPAANKGANTKRTGQAGPQIAAQKKKAPQRQKKIVKKQPEPEPNSEDDDAQESLEQKQEAPIKKDQAPEQKTDEASVKKEDASTNAANQDAAEDADDSHDGQDDDSNIIDFSLVGDEDDQQRIVYQKHVQREVDRLWHPPVGVPKGTVCTVFFSVDAEGNVEEVKFVKRSGVLIFDLSIMQVAKKYQFNKCLWNKQFKIDFRQ